MTQIVTCIDGSSISEDVCRAAAWVSQRVQAPLTLLHILEKETTQKESLSGNLVFGAREQLLKQMTDLDEARAKLAKEHGKELLAGAEQCAQECGAVEIKKQQRHGGVVETLLELQDDIRVLVVGRQGEAHSTIDHELGSNLEALIRGIQRPVLVTVPHFKVPQNFMVAYDGSDNSEKALQAYANSPLLQGLPCHLVMIGHKDTQHETQFHAAAKYLQQQGFEVVSAHLEGDVQPTLATYQQQHGIDLMVMGAYGHSRIRQFFVGSNTRKMVSQSDIPLLLLR